MLDQLVQRKDNLSAEIYQGNEDIKASAQRYITALSELNREASIVSSEYLTQYANTDSSSSNNRILEKSILLTIEVITLK